MKHKLILIASILSLTFGAAPEARSQWVQTTAPSVGAVNCFAVSGTNLFAGTSGGGVYLSTDNGTSWTAIGGIDKGVPTLAVSGTNLFVATDEGDVALTTNNGASWNSAVTGLTNTRVFTLLVSGTNLFAGTGSSGVFSSSDNGTSWTAVNTGLTNPRILALAVNGTNLFAGTYGGGVFLSPNNGASWTPVNTGLTNDTVISLLVNGTNLFAGTYGGGVFLSPNNGANWTAVNTGLTDLYVFSFAVSGANLFAGTGHAGAWRRPLSEFGSSDVPVRVQASSMATSYPNPFSQSTTIRFSSTDRGRVEIRIVNLLGAEVARIFTGELDAGEHSFTWDAIGVPPGRYQCIIRMKSCAEQLPILLVR